MQTLACEAGKHVYVEKPCSHNYRESRLLLDAARRNNVVVQHGTQSRSDGSIAGAVQMLREGVIGDVLMAKAWNVQTRANIATRLGRSLHVDTQRETIHGDEEATRLLSRDYRDGGHWAIPKGV